jgi:hypothetical protein
MNRKAEPEGRIIGAKKDDVGLIHHSSVRAATSEWRQYDRSAAERALGDKERLLLLPAILG